ncbi:MAG: general stress protein CsbD [Burkholderiales bacterium RIFCSPLOWO2_02_FULL_57_36]|nr:MAG: general stress protein CsbD [Burkholderiales bacterium RIFCSPLOWO2_02_FULL_57_36]
MNKDQIKGGMKDAAGKIQKEAGKVVGSKEHQAKGMSKQAEGKVQKGVGNVKDAMRDTRKDH